MAYARTIASADAEHDYEIIRSRGFGSRLLCVNDRDTLVPVDV
jgi:hypothetical protein